MKENNMVTTTEKPKPVLTKKQKLCTALVVLFAAIGILAAVIATNQTAIMSQVIYAFMPSSINVSEYDESLDLVLYIEKNDDFDAKADENEPLKAYLYYYYDENDEKVVLNYDDSIYEGTDNETMVSALFYLQAMEKLGKVTSVLKIVAVVAAVLLVVGGIVLWFILWSKKYDAQKQQQQHSTQKRKKKKKKK